MIIIITKICSNSYQYLLKLLWIYMLCSIILFFSWVHWQVSNFAIYVSLHIIINAELLHIKKKKQQLYMNTNNIVWFTPQLLIGCFAHSRYSHQK